MHNAGPYAASIRRDPLTEFLSFASLMLQIEQQQSGEIIRYLFNSYISVFWNISIIFRCLNGRKKSISASSHLKNKITFFSIALNIPTFFGTLRDLPSIL
jgi:hypothetical protein